ncbi:hypothetical protein RHGRI_007103 [Rhododendron griersonianum]|uniref:Uncharacterized protein n=1 Tax=Rhododendron griersonianum TaxID=479676 RepID=A0AAV6KVU7_9ERIC|nr:hypothetical protein RHGRI_007103 [Rhododendron griersonianum]
MCDFRDAPTTLRMPFPCLVTKILRTRNVPGKRFYSNDDLLPGDLDSSFIHRSMAQLRGVEGSLLTPPPASASTKTWLEKIFGRWPALEVSDDFADEPEEEEHSDAGDGN